MEDLYSVRKIVGNYEKQGRPKLTKKRQVEKNVKKVR